LITQATLQMQLLFRGLCTIKVTLYFKLLLLLIKRETKPARVELIPR